MPVIAPTPFATVQEFLGGGMTGAAVKTAPCDLRPVSVVGAGTGAVTPGGILDVGNTRVATVTVDLLVVVGGPTGTATFQWRTNGGPWSIATVTPVAPSVALPLGLTGLTAGFTGSLTAGDVWSFVAVSCVQTALDAWNARMDEVYFKRLGATPTTWSAMAVQRVVEAARRQVLTARGYNPENEQDKAMADAGDAAMAWFDKAEDGKGALPGDPAVPGVLGAVASVAQPPMFSNPQCFRAY